MNILFGNRPRLTLLLSVMAIAGCQPAQQEALLSKIPKVTPPPSDSQNAGAKPDFKLLNLPPAISAVREVNITVEGVGLKGYTYAISKGGSCSDVVMSELRSFDQPIVEVFESGNYSLCIKGLLEGGAETELKAHTWEVDTTVPSAYLDVLPLEHNISAYFSAQIKGENATHYKYKFVVGRLAPEQCGTDGYSNAYTFDESIVYQLNNDGEHSLCLVGVSRAGTGQPVPTVFNFIQDAKLPAAQIVSDSGNPLPTVVDGSDLSIKLRVLNLAAKYSYQLVTGSGCPGTADVGYPKKEKFPDNNEVSIILSAQDLARDLSEQTKRVTKSLCVVTEKPAPLGRIRENLESVQFTVDKNTLVINENNISGLPVNPSISSTYVVNIVQPDASTNFIPATSKMYYKVETVAAPRGLAPCNLNSVAPVKFSKSVNIDQIIQKGWYRFCLKLENAAGTQSNSVGVTWYKDVVVAKLPTKAPNSLDLVQAANQKLLGTAKSPGIPVTIESILNKETSSFEFKFKYFVGGKFCEDDNSPFEAATSIASKLQKNPLATNTGIHTLCVLGIEKDENGFLIAAQSEPSRFQFFHDETAPTMVVSGVPTGASNRTTFTARVDVRRNGVYSAAEDAIRVSFATAVLKGANTTCPQKSATASYTRVNVPAAGTNTGIATRAFTNFVTAADDGQLLRVCIFATDASGNTSDIQNMEWIFDISRPRAEFRLTTPDIKAGARSNARSAKLVVSPDGDVVSYRTALIAATDCTSAKFSGVKNISPDSPELINIAGIDGNRVLCIVARDRAGNEQLATEPTSLGWTLDTTPPKFSLTGAPTGTVKAATLESKVGIVPVSGGEPIDSFDFVVVETPTCPETGYSKKTSLLKENVNKQLVDNPIIFSTTAVVGTTKKFSLCVRGYDEAGNVSKPVITSWSQTAP